MSSETRLAVFGSVAIENIFLPMELNLLLTVSPPLWQLVIVSSVAYQTLFTLDIEQEIAHEFDHLSRWPGGGYTFCSFVTWPALMQVTGI
jgi:hypothetical protein